MTTEQTPMDDTSFNTPRRIGTSLDAIEVGWSLYGTNLHVYVSDVGLDSIRISSLQIDDGAERGKGALTAFLDWLEPQAKKAGTLVIVQSIRNRRLVKYLARRGYIVERDEGRGFGRSVDMHLYPPGAVSRVQVDGGRFLFVWHEVEPGKVREMTLKALEEYGLTAPSLDIQRMPFHGTVGLRWRYGLDGTVYLCTSYDARIGFWMVNEKDPKDIRNVSENAPGRTFHRIHSQLED